MNYSRRCIVIGDLHGCVDEFDELIKTIQYNKNSDRLVLCGDLVDRGTDSIGCIDRAIELGAESVRGNHENKLLRHFLANKNYGGQSYYKDLSKDHMRYIENMPYYIRLSEDTVVVHAGIKPNISIEDQNIEDLMFLRFTDKDRNFISLRKIYKNKAPEAMFWTEFGPFGMNVVYGHHVHSTDNVKIDNFEDGYKCFGIDQGCVFGGNLTAIIFNKSGDQEIVQVKAKQQYYGLDLK